MADTANDPANIAEARPGSERGQGTLSQLPNEAIAEAAASSVDLDADPGAESARQGARSGIGAESD